jgi:hypothetical protein
MPLNTRIKELNILQQRIILYVGVQVFYESFGAVNETPVTHIFTQKNIS